MWQDIETAPKDGTSILVWNGQWVQISYWCRGYTGSAGWMDGWYEDESNGTERVFHDYGDTTPESPTHWQPLPQPPIGTSRP